MLPGALTEQTPTSIWMDQAIPQGLAPGPPPIPRTRPLVLAWSLDPITASPENLSEVQTLGQQSGPSDLGFDTPCRCLRGPLSTGDPALSRPAASTACGPNSLPRAGPTGAGGGGRETSEVTATKVRTGSRGRPDFGGVWAKGTKGSGMASSGLSHWPSAEGATT